MLAGAREVLEEARLAVTPRERLRASLFRLARGLLALRRSSPSANAKLLRARGESTDAVRFREATPDDIPALAELHVRTWNDTYAPLMRGPPVGVRAAQWRAAFADSPRRWFCFVAVRQDGAPVGFAKGILREGPGDPGELNKLYVDREYQGLGLGSRLIGRVAQRFLDYGVTAMSAYVDPRNPSCGFFEKHGGEWLTEDGRVNFSWYVWKDLARFHAPPDASSPGSLRQPD